MHHKTGPHITKTRKLYKKDTSINLFGCPNIGKQSFIEKFHWLSHFKQIMHNCSKIYINTFKRQMIQQDQLSSKSFTPEDRHFTSNYRPTSWQFFFNKINLYQMSDITTISCHFLQKQSTNFVSPFCQYHSFKLACVC